MKFKGTKGEWKQDPVNKLDIDCNGEKVAKARGRWGKKDEDEANAQLIASAPELLEALNLMVNNFLQTTNGAQNQARIKAIKAIAKALNN